MRVAIGLSIATGLPWQYWERQTDEVIATALDVLERAHGKQKGRAPADDEPAVMMKG